MSAPRIDTGIMSAQNSQERGVPFASVRNPTTPKSRENKIAVRIPFKRPQRSESRPLLFFTLKNPPKKAEVYNEKKDRGARRGCGFFGMRANAEKITSRAKRIIIEASEPKQAQPIAPLAEAVVLRFFFFIAGRYAPLNSLV